MAIQYKDANAAIRNAAGSHAGTSGDPDVSFETVNTTLGTLATSANQATANTSLASIATNTAASATAANQATSNTNTGAISTAIGTQADAAATGNGTVVGILKQLRVLLSAALSVTQSGTWTVQPGNTANTTAWKVDNSAVTQPVSAASLPLPTGAATAAKQPALGTAGTASTDVITVQGIASGVAQPVSGTFWQATQPVSGTVAVTGVATSANQTTANTSLSNLDTKIGEVQASPTSNTVLDRLKAIATALAGTLTVATHAVTQSGTWNVGTVTAVTNVVHVDDNAGSLTVDGTVGISGTIPVAGNVASGATDSGNPVKAAGVYNSTLPTFTNGQRGDLQLDVNGKLIVSGAGGGGGGDASAANQVTGNASLASLDTKLGEVQASPTANTMLDRLKAIATALAGTLTVATHAVTQSGTWTVQPGNTANTTAWKVDGSAVTQPVSGTLTAVTTVGTVTNVVHVDDNTGSLTIDSPGLPTALTAGGNLKVAIQENTAAATVSTVLQTAATANGNGSTGSLDGYSTALFSVAGITTATINFEVSNDGGTTWFASLATQVGGKSIATTATVDGLYRIAAAGLKLARARISGYSAGTITVTLYTTTAATSNKVIETIPVASETHLGEVAGSGKAVKVALTVTAAAYSSGNSIGGKITIANAVRVTGGAALLTGVEILDRANQKPTGTIYIFDADPTAATLTDKTAFVFSTDDLKKVAQIPVAAADYVTTNSKATASLANLARLCQAASGTTLYAAFVTTSSPTFSATTDMQIIFNFVYVN